MIRHLSGLAEIVDDVDEAVRYYRDKLQLNVDYTDGEPYAVVKVRGILHMGLWKRSFAAERMLGSADKAGEVPLGFLVGFEVDDVPEAAKAFAAAGGTQLQAAQSEPWGQETSRFATTSGAVIELTSTPWARRLATEPAAGSDSDP